MFLLFPQIHNFCMENINELNWINWICTALRCCALIDQRHDWDLTDFSLYHFLLITEVHFQNTEKKSNKEARHRSDIITVRVITGSTVKMCSHSDKESYKNLRQSESRWLNWSCSCSNTITHYWHTETNTATTHELKTELRVKSASLDCDLSWDRRVRLSYAQKTLIASPKKYFL